MKTRPQSPVYIDKEEWEDINCEMTSNRGRLPKNILFQTILDWILTRVRKI